LRSSNDKVKRFFDAYAEKFDALYGVNVRHNFFNRILRSSVYERFRLAAANADELDEGFSVLDVGTGPGRYLSLLAPRAGRLVGVDLSEGMLGPARARAESEGYAGELELRAGDFLGMDFNEEFDLVLAFGYFDYISDPSAHFRRMVELSRSLVLATFPKRWHVLTLQRKIRYLFGRCPVRFYSLREIGKILESLEGNGVEIMDLGREYYVRVKKSTA
jgi:ubiquinone/menaquinone biosynthesis C-methylase UbiE